MKSKTGYVVSRSGVTGRVQLACILNDGVLLIYNSACNNVKGMIYTHDDFTTAYSMLFLSYSCRWHKRFALNLVQNESLNIP